MAPHFCWIDRGRTPSGDYVFYATETFHFRADNGCNQRI